MDLYNLVLSAKITKGEGGGGDEPTGTKEITANGTYNVKSYASAHVDVPVPSGYIIPSGTKQISSNGSFDVTEFASAAVNISPIIQSLSISENGTYSVPAGVDGYNPITVNVSGGGGGGDHDAEDAIIARNISGAYENSRVTTVGSYAFCYCTSLVSVNLLMATHIGNYAFQNCSNLTTASLPKATEISEYTFRYCTKLESVYLLASSVASLTSKSAFQSTPMSSSSLIGHYGSIYVPASLVSAYKSATNWSAYSARITSYTE